LWLSPITGAPSGDFGYAVTDYFRVRPSLGSDDDLRALIGAAHARGMHVILDLVVNHLSDRHPYADDAAVEGRRSPYFDFLARTAAGAVAHYFNWQNLDNLNYGNEQVERMIIAASAYWVREFHVDGFRVDAAWGPRMRAPHFWPRWRAELKRINPDLLLIAEASARDSYYLHHGFDAAYDWTSELGQSAWHDAFDDPSQTVRRLQAAIGASPGAAVLRFLDNNDTGKRFIARYGAARTRVAAAMLLTLPGLPALYTGDEIAADYEPYRTTQPISWTDPSGMTAWYSRLLALRHREPALRSNAIQLLPLASAPNVLAYLRTSADGADKLLVLLNYGAEPANVLLNALPQKDQSAGAVDLLNGEEFAGSGLRSTVQIKRYGVRILKLR
jgi:glycosidase